jgi:hypothetical protein
MRAATPLASSISALAMKVNSVILLGNLDPKFRYIPLLVNDMWGSHELMTCGVNSTYLCFVYFNDTSKVHMRHARVLRKLLLSTCHISWNVYRSTDFFF